MEISPRNEAPNFIVKQPPAFRLKIPSAPAAVLLGVAFSKSAERGSPLDHSVITTLMPSPEIIVW